MVDALRSFLVLAAEFAGIYLAVSWGVHLIVATVPRQRLRSLLAGNPARGLGLALLLGAVTPFCSCSPGWRSRTWCRRWSSDPLVARE